METRETRRGSPEAPVVFPGTVWLVNGNRYEPYLESCLNHIRKQVCPEATMLPPFLTKPLDPGITFTAREAMGFINSKLNEIIDEFLSTDATHLWFVDADNEVPPNALSSLLRWDADLASGVSPGHGSPTMSTVMRWMPPASPEFPWSMPYYKPLPMKDILGRSIDGSMFKFATGHFCLLAKRRVFDWLRFQWSPEQKFGNEILFWEYAQNLGLRCVIDGSVLCGHLPEHPLAKLEKELDWSNLSTS